MSETAFFVWGGFDPVAFSLGPVMVRWYGLAYLAGFLLGWWYAVHLVRSYPLAVKAEHIDDSFLTWIVIGVIVGGRLGYVVFYNPEYYIMQPWQILYLWQGGMSFHGGMLGVVLAVWFYCRRQGLAFLALLDVMALVAPIGLFFGRLANFVNGELYGRATDVAWAVIFPHAGLVPRHPSQLYEAFGEGILLLLVLRALLFIGDKRKGGLLQRQGVMSFAFLIGYGVVRFLVEFVREPDSHLGLFFGLVTMGQLLSMCMVLAAFIALKVLHHRRHTALR